MSSLNPKKLDFLSNLGMVAFGLSALILISFEIRWGFVIGLCSQLFFLFVQF